MIQYMLTTIDNPFDPFTQTDQWRSYDVDHGHYTSEYLARIAKTDEEMSEEDYNNEIKRACEEVLAYNPLKIYKIVKHEM